MLSANEIAQPVGLTLTLALIVTAILIFVATPIAWWLTRSRSIWKEPVAAIVSLPLVLPPTVLGFYLLLAFGPNGPGGLLAPFTTFHNWAKRAPTWFGAPTRRVRRCLDRPSRSLLWLAWRTFKPMLTSTGCSAAISSRATP